ncbi:hypothetical protein [Comamonas odontotermitis]|uniref:hypothetical protein n=1 Tax=Comamonas TaxID=283 RepID=UPI001CC79F12|nr:hypothetical protein [Comamonas odontotermitis]UBB15447.1 hypothetical protein LAD35_11230 [Comamonas odontotermitis]
MAVTYMKEANALAAAIRGTGKTEVLRKGGRTPATVATPDQLGILAFMREFFTENDQLPPINVSAKRFGMTPNAMQWHVNALVRFGYLEKNAVGKYRFARIKGVEA